MARTATGRVALFSIHPDYAQAILNGTKKVEFRRQGLPEDVTHVVIYATAPIQQVVGMFEVAGVERLTPRRAWTTYQRVGGIKKHDFERYYLDTDAAFVIRVRKPRRFTRAFRLTDLDEALRPPQSYMYLNGERLDRARSLSQAIDRKEQLDIDRPLVAVGG
ncbi:ASCH domain-containing protein [Nocardioides humi]|uniref:ASCH domain-containing protein n=1 Tax=Nocardioides humi TaxID=449461 RepID=A0ABN2BXD5_9ACTN|nr:ASCH domain-containing protein [Nocardioides humi]